MRCHIRHASVPHRTHTATGTLHTYRAAGQDCSVSCGQPLLYRHTAGNERWHVTSCHVMSRHTSCACDATICQVMPYHAMSYHVIYCRLSCPVPCVGASHRCVSLVLPCRLVSLTRSCLTPACCMWHAHLQHGSLTCAVCASIMAGNMMQSTHGSSDMQQMHMTQHGMYSSLHGGTSSCSSSDDEQHTHTHTHMRRHTATSTSINIHPHAHQHMTGA